MSLDRYERKRASLQRILGPLGCHDFLWFRDLLVRPDALELLPDLVFDLTVRERVDPIGFFVDSIEQQDWVRWSNHLEGTPLISLRFVLIDYDRILVLVELFVKPPGLFPPGKYSLEVAHRKLIE